MKKTLPIAIIAASLLGLGSLSSCHDEDFDVSTAVLQEHAFEQAFIKEFGKPSADQSWDFYSQKMQSIRQEAGLTRATMETLTITVDTTISQPTDDYFNSIVANYGYALEEKHDNSTVGQNHYNLISSGDFNIYAVRYAGGIETNEDYKLDFGIAYIDDKGTTSKEDDEEIRINIFGPGYRSKAYKDACDSNGWGNPGKGASVSIPPGKSFYFYLSTTWHFNAWSEQVITGYDRWGRAIYETVNHPAQDVEQIFRSNETPYFIQRNGENLYYNEYGGTSTLLYSVERIVADENKDEQVMMIGFEDAWGHQSGVDGLGNTSTWLDRDFNDVVVVIEGELPIPTSKRFFVEDKMSYDWDYNDIVFDVSSNGIVLRAVGGTLPVWLRVTDRLGTTTTHGELHQLMKSLQPAPSKPTDVDHSKKKLTYELDGKTLYKPIAVASNPGLWLNPVQILRWEKLGNQETYTRLDEDEVERFANPLAGSNKIGNIQVIIGSEYGQTLEQALALAKQPNSDGLWENGKEYVSANRPKIVEISDLGGIPAMWSAGVSAQWMKEMQKITLGYELFYNGTAVVNEEVKMWWETAMHPDYFYPWEGDVDPDEPY